MVEYLDKFPHFIARQHLPEDKILELVEFSLPKECQKELLIQGFDSTTQGLMELVNFCKRLKTAEEVFQTQGEVNHQNKKTKQSGERHQSAKSAQSKGSYQAANPSEEDSNKNKTQNKTSSVCLLHGLGHDMSLCKVILAQSKAMKSTWSTARDGGAGRVRFQGLRSARPMAKSQMILLPTRSKHFWNQINRREPRTQVIQKPEDEKEHYNFETLKIGGEW